MASGSKILLKNFLISITLFTLILTGFGVAFSLSHGEAFDPARIINNFYENTNFQKEWPILPATIIVILLLILFLGKYYKAYIIKRNRIRVNFATILVAWMCMLITCSLTEGLLKLGEYGFSGFVSSAETWMQYGAGTFLLLAIINFLMIGFWMGKGIKKGD